MKVQWFPGHMTKALRMMDENSKLVDCFIYVLDARAYKSCINPSFNDIIKDKPVLYILNKADMIEKNAVKCIIEDFNKKGFTILPSNSRASGSNKEIVNALRKINSEKLERYRLKNVNRSIRAMVIGVPNTGKSTLINKLCGNKRTITGNRPGVTRGKQWVVIDNYLELLDTPGTLCPAFNDESTATNMAFIGSIKDAVINLEQLTAELIAYLRDYHLPRLNLRYNIEAYDKSPQEIINNIADRRGYILKGNEYDYDRAYTAIIDDFRKCKIGRIALELP